jgi:hypothetical protein
MLGQGHDWRDGGKDGRRCTGGTSAQDKRERPRDLDRFSWMVNKKLEFADLERFGHRSMSAWFLLLSTRLLIFAFAAAGRAMIPGWIAWVFVRQSRRHHPGRVERRAVPVPYSSVAATCCASIELTDFCLSIAL